MMDLDGEPTQTVERTMDAVSGSVDGGLPPTMQALAEGLTSLDDDELELDADPVTTVGTFFVGELELALDANCVREVVAFPKKVTPVPQAGSGVVGIFSLRGEIMPILDVSSILDIDRAMPLEDCRVAIIDVGEGHIGMLFSRTGEVLRVPPEDCFPIASSAQQTGMIVEGVIQLDAGQRFIQQVSPELLRGLPGVPFTSSGTRESRSRKPPVVYHKAVVVRVGEHSLAFPMENLVEIRERSPLQASPAYFEHCEGILHVRGSVLAAMSLRSYLGLPADHHEGKFVFVQDSGVTIALEVDSLVAAMEYPEDAPLPLPALPPGGIGGFCRKVLPTDDETQVLLADVSALFAQNKVASAASILNHHEEGDEKTEQRAAALEEDRSLFTFHVGTYFLSLDMTDVLEVQRVPENVVRTGSKESALQGIMDLRGSIVPLVDLRTLFDTRMPASSEDQDNDPVVIVIEYDGGPYGMIVDRIDSVLRFQPSQASEVPTALNRKSMDGIMPYVASALMLPSEAANGQIVLVLGAEALAGSVVLAGQS